MAIYNMAKEIYTLKEQVTFTLLYVQLMLL
jgi:hypothetical protein